MSEANNGQDSSEQVNADKILDLRQLSENTLKLIAETCSDQHQDTYPLLHPQPMRDLGLDFDENIDCSLMCNPETLEVALDIFLKSRLHTDVRIHVQGKVFECHLLMLQVSSGYFKQFSSSEDIIIDSPEVSAVGFDKVYDWMVHKDEIPQSEHILDVYLTARFLDIPPLINQLWYCFQNSEFYSEGHAFQLYLQAVKFDTSTLQSLLLTQMSRFFLSAVATSEFLHLKPQKVYDMLSNSIVSVNSEIEILISALRWLLFAWNARKAYVPLLMKAVRFNQLPAWYLVTLKVQQTQTELREIFESPEVLSAINSALSYSITQQFISTESILQENLQMVNGPERDWIIDENADHHHLYKCHNWKYLSFDHFNDYLKQVINAGPFFHKTLKLRNTENMMPCCQAMAFF